MSDVRMKALRQAVMRQAIRYVDSWQVGDGPATFALAVADEMNRRGWTICRATDAPPERWRIHDPVGDSPRLFYVFTTENDARTALLALGDSWRLDEPSAVGVLPEGEQ